MRVPLVNCRLFRRALLDRAARVTSDRSKRRRGSIRASQLACFWSGAIMTKTPISSLTSDGCSHNPAT